MKYANMRDEVGAGKGCSFLFRLKEAFLACVDFLHFSI